MNIQPFYLEQSTDNAHVVFFYRNFMKKSPDVFSHIGLGVNATHMVKTLRANGVKADLCPVWDTKDIDAGLAKYPTTTHAIIEAPFLGVNAIVPLIRRHENITFICRNHSQIGFLQVEAGAIDLIRQYLHIQDSDFNFKFAANNLRYCHYIETTYNSNCLYLPNLYFIERPLPTGALNPNKVKEIIRIGSFGSLRLLKNHTSAAAAAQMIAKSRKANLEFWISVGREEHGKGVLQALKNMFAGLKWATLVENQWQEWSEFRHTIAFMDLCIQMSMTETFNLVTADAAYGGVPSVVSNAIEWVPSDWIANIDDPWDIAKTGKYLMHNTDAITEGRNALERYVRKGIDVWKNYLNGQKISSNPQDY